MESKGLILVYDPHNLYQFLWYYCTYGKDMKWDALCLPNEGKGEYMSAYCKRVGIFEQVYSDETEYVHMPLSKKIGIFMKMFGHAITGRRVSYCKKLLNQYVNIDEYKKIVVMTDVGFVSGACLALGAEKSVVVLEDGVGDYVERTNRNLVRNITNLYDWQGYLMAKLGYSNVGHHYPLKTTKYCEKFCSHPEYMIYRDYASLHQLFDYTNTDKELLDALIEKVYPEIATVDFEKLEAVLFTATIKSFTSEEKKYVEKIQEYMNCRYKNILVKKHPRDTIEYEFAPDMEIQNVAASVPAEALLHYIRGKALVFASFSATLFYLDSVENDIKILYMKGLHKECVEQNTYLMYDTLETVQNHLKQIHMEEIPIVEL